ncbi:hypothetical protein BN2497_5881 [Janthinobacterium sp. CG23_2]|nr:hypothetical protein BN2497_5881 [Janthinobacterium sp. CG23_2]CUU29338.1 hypothetical protein BN3177_5881 [Janthinobacterium sp. CG23_2]
MNVFSRPGVSFEVQFRSLNMLGQYSFSGRGSKTVFLG